MLKDDATSRDGRRSGNTAEALKPVPAAWLTWLRISAICLLLLFALVGLYRFKSKMGIDLFRSFSLKKMFHLRAVHAEIRRALGPPKPGLLISDTFLRSWIAPELASFWSRIPGAADYAYGKTVEGDESCLRVENRNTGDWTYVYEEYFPVTPGDKFAYEGRFQTDPGVGVSFGIILYARDGRALDWKYADSGETETLTWLVRQREFAVPAGIDSIRFYLSGSGRGKCWFTRAKFRKLASGSHGDGEQGSFLQ